MVRLITAVVGVLVVFASLSTPVAGDSVTVTVSVVDQDDDPVSNADLTVTWDGGSTSATTAGNGKAFVDVPQGADLTIEVDHPNYVRNRPFLLSNASETEVTVPVHRKGSVRFVVRDDGGAVADARVVLRQQGRVVANGRTTDDGMFVVPALEWGEYTVSVVKEGYFRETDDVEVGGAIRHQVTLESGTVIYTFNVTDPRFDPPRPVADATLELEGVGTTVTTRQDGRATVGVPVNSEFELTASKDGYRAVTRSMSVEETDAAVNVSLSRTPEVTLSTANERVLAGERVVVEAVDEYGDPIEGATVYLDGAAVGETEADGDLAVPVEETGEHVLRARAGDVESNPVSVEAVRAGEETATTTATTTPTSTSDSPSGISAPGFTAPLAVLALLVVALAAPRVRRRR